MAQDVPNGLPGFLTACNSVSAVCYEYQGSWLTVDTLRAATITNTTPATSDAVSQESDNDGLWWLLLLLLIPLGLLLCGLVYFFGPKGDTLVEVCEGVGRKGQEVQHLPGPLVPIPSPGTGCGDEATSCAMFHILPPLDPFQGMIARPHLLCLA